MKTVGLFDVKTHLSALVEEVAAGETICITRRGKAVAKIVPMEEKPPVDLHKIAAEMRAARKGVKLGRGTQTIREMIHEGHRY